MKRLISLAALSTALALGAMAAAAAAPVAALPQAPILDAPVADMRMVRAFDRPESPWGAGHRGIDIAAAPGEAVLAPADGVVAFAATLAGRGVIVVAHAGGLRSTLEPARATVAQGAAVAGGDEVGRLEGAGWHCDTACLHWGVRRGDDYLDPLDVLRGYGEIVLLPTRTRPS